MINKPQTALIIGAGPAGLSAAYELLQKTDVKPILLEKSSTVGGMCASTQYKGNFIDAGGHRYFTKFDSIKKWWLHFLPLQTVPSKDDIALKRDLKLEKDATLPPVNPQETDDVMLKRFKLCRIYYLRKFFDYPVSLNFNTICGLGLMRMTRIFLSYLKAKIFRIKDEKNAEDFLINTFGQELYRTFFKDYTEKLWGIECCQISAEWGRERIRGIRFWNTLISLFKNMFIHTPKPEDPYLYPKFGPGQIWNKVAEEITSLGAEIRLNTETVKINTSGNKIISVIVRDESGQEKTLTADYIISSLPIQNLINMMNDVPANIKAISDGLMYRNFRTAAVLLNRLKVQNHSKIATLNGILPDTWVYVQESDVKMGRFQMYNNWSPYLLQDDSKVWMGFEYFAGDNDEIWTMSNNDFEKLAVSEAAKVGLIEEKDVLEVTSVKLEKAYPAYFGTYCRFGELRQHLDSFENLYLIGRNGMHKYINIDHVILSGMAVADNIARRLPNKDNIWNIDITKILD